MKLAFLNPGHLYRQGGALFYVQELTAALAERGHEVTLVTDRPGPEVARVRRTAPGVRLVELDRDTRPEQRAAARLRLEQRRGCYRLSRWLFRSGRQQLLASGPWCPGLTAGPWWHEADAVVLCASSVWCWNQQLQPLLRSRRHAPAGALPFFHFHESPGNFPVQAPQHRGYDFFLTLTGHEARGIRRLGLTAPAHVLGAGSVDLPPPRGDFRSRHGVPDSAPLLLFLGRKIYNKGVTHVVQAMDQVWDAFPEARLALVGFSHNPRAWLQGYLSASRHPAAAARTLDLDDVDDAEREEALAACTGMVAPSISDSFGLVYLDAWRHGKPVVGCRDTCCESIITDGVNGRLVAFGDTTAIARTIRGWLEDPSSARRQGEAGRTRLEADYRWPAVAARLEAALVPVAREGDRP